MCGCRFEIDTDSSANTGVNVSTYELIDRETGHY